MAEVSKTYYDELEEQRLKEEAEQLKLEEDKQALLQSLSLIKDDPYRTRKDVADYVRATETLQGKDTYEDLDDSKVLALSQALEDPDYLEPYSPTYRDVTDFQHRTQTAMMFTHYMPAFLFLSLGTDSEVGQEVARKYPQFDKPPEEMENEVSWAKEQVTKNMLQNRNPSWTPDIVNQEFERIKTDQKYSTGKALEILREARRKSDEIIANDPKARAIQEWVQRDGFIEEGQYFKYLGNLFETVAPTFATAWASGKVVGTTAAGIAAGTAATLGGGPTPDDPFWAGGAYIVGSATGTFVTMGLLEGGSYLYEQWSSLTQSERIDERELREDLQRAREFYSDKIKKS